jgi:nicotinamide-nucleotide adenylyltransferase
MKKDKRLIPYGPYCYSGSRSPNNKSYKPCIYWDMVEGDNGESIGYCHFIEKGDNEFYRKIPKIKKGEPITYVDDFSAGLLWDQVKECGINYEFIRRTKKEKYKHGLTIGRFQPFHKGHRYLIRKMLNECDKITVLIGSSQEYDTEKNPFTLEDRKEMISNVFDTDIKNGRLSVSGIEDINDMERWADYTLSRFKNDLVDIYYAGSEEDLNCFKKIKNLKLKNINRVEVSKDNNFKSGTEIRKLIYDKNIEWKKYVPKANWGLIRRIISPV